MKKLALIVVAFGLSLLTGWVVTLIVTAVFCDGFQPNWLCSGHGGAWLFIMLLTILISMILYTYAILRRR